MGREKRVLQVRWVAEIEAACAVKEEGEASVKAERVEEVGLAGAEGGAVVGWGCWSAVVAVSGREGTEAVGVDGGSGVLKRWLVCCSSPAVRVGSSVARALPLLRKPFMLRCPLAARVGVSDFCRLDGFGLADTDSLRFSAGEAVVPILSGAVELGRGES